MSSSVLGNNTGKSRGWGETSLFDTLISVSIVLRVVCNYILLLLQITARGKRLQRLTKWLEQCKRIFLDVHTQTQLCTWQKWVLRCFIFYLEVWMYSVLHCITTKKPVHSWREEVVACSCLVISCSKGAFQEERMTDR